MGGMGCTRAVLETLNGVAGEDVGWRATHSGFMLRRWMGPCLTGSGQPRDVSPYAIVSSGAVEGKRQVQPRGVGSPLHPTVPHSHGSSTGVPSWEVAAPALAFGSSSVSWSIRCCWGCARDAAAQPVASGWPRSLPETPSVPAGTVPKAGGSGRAAGRRGLLLPSIPVPAPVGAALKTPIDFPTRLRESMSSRPLLDGDTLR